MDIANASLLDEGTAAAEAMTLCKRLSKNKGANAFFVSSDCHPQTIDVVRTRAEPLGIEVVVGDDARPDGRVDFFGALLQYPATNGDVARSTARSSTQFHAANALVAVAADLLALTLLTPPGEFGADVAIGSAQRFGVPLGFGGPHAAYFATQDAFKRDMPGRLVGVSIDRHGQPGATAWRCRRASSTSAARRPPATSAPRRCCWPTIASMYAVYHGPEGLQAIAERVHALTAILAAGLAQLGVERRTADVLRHAELRHRRSHRQRCTRRRATPASTCARSTRRTWACRSTKPPRAPTSKRCGQRVRRRRDACRTSTRSRPAIADAVRRPCAAPASSCTHPVFNRYHSETELLRYLRRLADKDLALDRTMIPLGSCTMKLNAASEMIPVTWPEFGALHPFAPADADRTATRR